MVLCVFVAACAHQAFSHILSLQDKVKYIEKLIGDSADEHARKLEAHRRELEDQKRNLSNHQQAFDQHRKQTQSQQARLRLFGICLE